MKAKKKMVILISLFFAASPAFSQPLKNATWNMDSSISNCVKCNQQLTVLEEWIDARAAEETPFIVLGDFNQRMNIPTDAFWPEIDDGEPANADLARVTEGKISDCWTGEFPLYIDHIVLDRNTAQWVVEDSFKQLVYTEGESLEKKLSDHCPNGRYRVVMFGLVETRAGQVQVERPTAFRP